MLDYTQYNGSLGLICLFIYILMLAKSWPVYKSHTGYSNNYTFAFLGILLYCILGFLEWDTYHYYRIYEEMVKGYFSVHVEEIYFRLIKSLPHSYLLWRLCIWGTATILMIWSAKKLKLNSNVFCFIAAALFITRLAVSRSGLGIALLIFCSILLIQSLEKRQIITIPIAVTGILLSIHLHSSMLIFVGCMIIAYILPFNKKIILLSLILFPLLYVSLMQLIGPIISLLSLNEEQSSFISQYVDSEKLVSNVLGWIPIIIEKTSFILLMFLLTKKMVYDKIPQTSAHHLMFKYSYIMVYLSFLFFEQGTSSWICSRTLHAATFGLVLCTTFCFDNSEKKKRTNFEKLVLIMLILDSLWGQLYFIYKN